MDTWMRAGGGSASDDRSVREHSAALLRVRRELLAAVGHDLLTPLNGILGYAQLLARDPALNSSQRDALKNVRDCGERLHHLISSHLDRAPRVPHHEPVATGPDCGLFENVSNVRLAQHEREPDVRVDPCVDDTPANVGVLLELLSREGCWTAPSPSRPLIIRPSTLTMLFAEVTPRVDM